MKTYRTRYEDAIGRKHFCVWEQEGDKVRNIDDVIIKE